LTFDNQTVSARNETAVQIDEAGLASGTGRTHSTAIDIGLVKTGFYTICAIGKCADLCACLGVQETRRRIGWREVAISVSIARLPDQTLLRGAIDGIHAVFVELGTVLHAVRTTGFETEAIGAADLLNAVGVVLAGFPDATEDVGQANADGTAIRVTL